MGKRHGEYGKIIVAAPSMGLYIIWPWNKIYQQTTGKAQKFCSIIITQNLRASLPTRYAKWLTVSLENKLSEKLLFSEEVGKCLLQLLC